MVKTETQPQAEVTVSDLAWPQIEKLVTDYFNRYEVTSLEALNALARGDLLVEELSESIIRLILAESKQNMDLPLGEFWTKLHRLFAPTEPSVKPEDQ